jgi:integrase
MRTHLRLVSVSDSKESEMAQKKREFKRSDSAGIYKRGRRWAYTYRVEGRQRWGSADTFDEARRARRQAQADADRGVLFESEHIPFGRYATDWIATYQGRTANGLRESTRENYRMMLRSRVIPYFDRRRLAIDDIRPRDVKAFVMWLLEQQDPHSGRRLSKSSIRQHVAVLRAMFADATEDDLIRSNPAAGVRVSVPEGDGTGRAIKETKAMTIRQLNEVLDQVPAEWRLFFELLAQTGLRIGEIIELRWGRDVDLGDEPKLRVRWQWADGRVCAPKTRYGLRDIPLSPGIAFRLRAHRGDALDDSHVFASSDGTRVDRRNVYNRVLGPAAARAGYPWVTLHTFRHTCASILFAPADRGGGGKNVKQVQVWLGHHSPAFTLQQYVHLVDTGVGSADFFDDLP